MSAVEVQRKVAEQNILRQLAASQQRAVVLHFSLSLSLFLFLSLFLLGAPLVEPYNIVRYFALATFPSKTAPGLGRGLLLARR